MRSRIEPMKKIARSLRDHRELILNYFRAQKLLSSGVVEGLNNKAKVTMRKSYGFRTFRCLELALYHSLGYRCEKSRMRDRRALDQEAPPSDRQPKQPVDKLQLREWVTLAHPSGTALPNHVDRLDPLYRPPRRRKALVAPRQPDSLFRNAMVLLDYIV
jgi:hypothetical protein